jgi:sugar phosphate isomerase/epimerase
MIRLSCATLSFDGFGNNDFRNTFVMAPRAGYRNLELNCWYPVTLTPAKIADLGVRCRAAGLKPGSLHVSGFGAEGNDALVKDFCHKLRAVEAAGELGCGLVCATGAARGTQGGLDAIVEVLRELIPIAEARGVKVSLENHEANNLERLEDYERVLEAVPSPNLGITMDTGHFDAAGVRLDDLVDRLGDRINHIHLKENRGFGAKDFVRFGEGTTENRRIVERLIERGYSGYLVIEVSPEIAQKDGRPFGLDDLRRPYEMFHPYEREEP